MSQQTMRGMRLGAASLENERGVHMEARKTYSYQCALGHVSDLKFAANAEAPETWECKTCSREAILLQDGIQVELAFHEEKIPRSHWQMLLERRTVEELEVILEEQLLELRARREAAAEKLKQK
ncbi:MAG: hypothetical protein RL508_774 [Actinomycetota bacterium]|jgi:hypothetical protein